MSEITTVVEAIIHNSLQSVKDQNVLATKSYKGRNGSYLIWDKLESGQVVASWKVNEYKPYTHEVIGSTVGKNVLPLDFENGFDKACEDIL